MSARSGLCRVCIDKCQHRRVSKRLLCCGDACPIYPGKRYLNGELADPGGRPVDAVREIRDEIDQRVRALLAALVPAA